MKLTNKFKKIKAQEYYPPSWDGRERPEVPEGLVRKCNMCKAAIFTADVKKNHYICPKCKGYFRLSATRRIAMIVDSGSFTQWDTDLQTSNPLD